MKCPHCGQEHPDDTKFCPETGKQMKLQALFCNNPACNYRKPLPPTSKFCPNCGFELTIQESARKQNLKSAKETYSHNNVKNKLRNKHRDSYSLPENESFIMFKCADTASVRFRAIEEYEVVTSLNKGVNILSISQYPDIKRGFSFGSPYSDHDYQNHITEIDLTHFESSFVNRFTWMFRGCSSLKEINLESLSSARPTDLCFMFSECASLERVDLSVLDTSLVTGMWNMFDGCTNLKWINFKGFSTVNNTTFRSFFRDCKSIEHLDLSGFDTSSVKDGDNTSCLGGGFEAMFYGCTSLKEIDLSNFNTLGATVIDELFYGCSNLIDINLNNCDLSKIKSCKEMFNGCYSLKHISAYGCNRSTLRLIRRQLALARILNQVTIEHDNFSFRLLG